MNRRKIDDANVNINGSSENNGRQKKCGNKMCVMNSNYNQTKLKTYLKSASELITTASNKTVLQKRVHQAASRLMTMMNKYFDGRTFSSHVSGDNITVGESISLQRILFIS